MIDISIFQHPFNTILDGKNSPFSRLHSQPSYPRYFQGRIKYFELEVKDGVRIEMFSVPGASLASHVQMSRKMSVLCLSREG